MIYYKTGSTTNKMINYANRGMVLEEDINLTNEYYRDKGIALIYKKPTPIKIIKVDYKKAKINEAYFEAPSTLDYNGIYKGKYIEFDAKETNSKTSFPLMNIHKHQYEHIKGVINQGGIAFLVVRFNLLNQDYILMGNSLINFVESNIRKSIPIDYFEKVGYKLKMSYRPRLDYLKVIDKLL
jgi:recombination protein U